MIEGCGWTEGIVVFVAGDFFDTEWLVGALGLEPMSKFASKPVDVAFELHRHGASVLVDT